MAVTVGANMMSLVHASSAGVTIAFPDVCQTPSPAGPIPIPYPNIARSADTASGTSSIECDGNAICTSDSNFSISTGDEAGAVGGIASAKTKGKATFVNYSFDVVAEGKHVARAFDLMLHNDKNTPPFPLLQSPIVAIAALQEVRTTRTCFVCGEEF